MERQINTEIQYERKYGNICIQDEQQNGDHVTGTCLFFEYVCNLSLSFN